MAERLDDFPAAQRRRDGYPWDTWLDGSVWKLSQGDDFGATVPNFLSSAWKRANDRGLRLKSQRDPDGTVVIQAVPRG